MDASELSNWTEDTKLMIGLFAISTPLAILIYSHDPPSHKIVLGVVILLVSLVIFFLFRVAGRAGSRIGETAAQVMSKIMGLIIASLALEFMLDGIAEHDPCLSMIP